MNNFLHDFITNVLVANFQPLINSYIGRQNMIVYGVLFYNEFINSNILFNLGQEFHDYEEEILPNYDMAIFLHIDKKADNPIVLLTIKTPSEIISIYIVNNIVIYTALQVDNEILNVTNYFYNSNLNTNLEYFYSLISNFLNHYVDILKDEGSFIRNVESGYLVYNHFMTELLFPMLQYVNIPDYCLIYDNYQNYYTIDINYDPNNFQMDIHIILFNDGLITFDIQVGDNRMSGGSEFLKLMTSINPPYTIDDISKSKMSIEHASYNKIIDLTDLQNKLVNSRKKVLRETYDALDVRNTGFDIITSTIADYSNIDQEMKNYESSPEEYKSDLIGIGDLNIDANQSAIDSYDYLNNDTYQFINYISNIVLNILSDEKYLEYDEEKEELKYNICTICQFGLDENIIETICGHQFHYNCLRTWLKYRHNCPNCKRPINNHKEYGPLLNITTLIHEEFIGQYIVNLIRYLTYNNSDFKSYRKIIEQGIDRQFLHMNINLISKDQYYIVTFYIKIDTQLILYHIVIDKNTNTVIKATITKNDGREDKRSIINYVNNVIRRNLNMNLDE